MVIIYGLSVSKCSDSGGIKIFTMQPEENLVKCVVIGAGSISNLKKSLFRRSTDFSLRAICLLGFLENGEIS